LRRSETEESPCRVSISPSRKKQGAGFSVKPTAINHFTGKRIKDNEVKIEVDKPKDNEELFVQVGEQTKVFKYGEAEQEKPRLIEEYITFFKKKEGDKEKELVRKQLYGGNNRQRSLSQSALSKPGLRPPNLDPSAVEKP